MGRSGDGDRLLLFVLRPLRRLLFCRRRRQDAHDEFVTVAVRVGLDAVAKRRRRRHRVL